MMPIDVWGLAKLLVAGASAVGAKEIMLKHLGMPSQKGCEAIAEFLEKLTTKRILFADLHHENPVACVKSLEEVRVWSQDLFAALRKDRDAQALAQEILSEIKDFLHGAPSGYRGWAAVANLPQGERYVDQVMPGGRTQFLWDLLVLRDALERPVEMLAQLVNETVLQKIFGTETFGRAETTQVEGLLATMRAVAAKRRVAALPRFRA
jgi:hypothetical protein